MSVSKNLGVTIQGIDNKIDIIDGYHDLPDQDSLDNSKIRDVVGNKIDTHSANSLYGVIKLIREHIHNQVFLYPAKTASIQLQKALGVWAAYPTPTEIIPANSIAYDYDLHFLNVSAISANGEYTIALYKGDIGSEILIGEYGAVRNAVQSQEGSRVIITPLLSPNTRVSASLSSSNNAQDTINIKVEGHTYD